MRRLLKERANSPTPTRKDANHGTTNKTLEPYHGRFRGYAQHKKHRQEGNNGPGSGSGRQFLEVFEANNHHTSPKKT